MKFNVIGKIAGVLALTIGLAGCIDVTMDLEVHSETNAKATTTMTMGKDFYAMAKSGMAADQSGAAGGSTTSTSGGFCTEEGDVLTENPDGSATCTTTVEGAFADINKGDNQNGKFEVVGPGLVKVSFSTKDMQSEVASGTGSGDPAQAAQDEQTKAMMAALFEGHFITIRIKGKEVTETNMTKSADGTSAEIKIPFLDLMNGTAQLPEELFATVKVN